MDEQLERLFEITMIVYDYYFPVFDFVDGMYLDSDTIGGE